MATYKDYMLMHKLPHTWCAGCGHGIILQAIADVFAELELPKQNIALVSGIGCFGRVDDYLDINCVHVTHGRALAVATGVALANPELTVLATMGDGDGSTIGGNHLIHAARRNINVTAIIANNYNYGQTGGQYSGTTPEGSITSTSRYGHVENGFDLCELVKAAGAAYVARSSVYNPMEIRKLIREGFQTKGFSMIEIMEPCPTHFGKANKLGDSASMIRYLKEHGVPVGLAEKMSGDELEDKFMTGCLHLNPHEDYATRYQRIIGAQRVKEGEN